MLLKATGVGEAEDAARAPGSAADLGHIHGIGVNSADGQVYVGAHSGVFRVSEQQPPVLVSDRVQDFMGFTVVGPNHFLASGHPGRASSASVGLIESTDAGVTWTARRWRAGRTSTHCRLGMVSSTATTTRPAH